jgi:hypothetical protein
MTGLPTTPFRKSVGEPDVIGGGGGGGEDGSWCGGDGVESIGHSHSHTSGFDSANGRRESLTRRVRTEMYWHDLDGQTLAILNEVPEWKLYVWHIIGRGGKAYKRIMTTNVLPATLGCSANHPPQL